MWGLSTPGVGFWWISVRIGMELFSLFSERSLRRTRWAAVSGPTGGAATPSPLSRIFLGALGCALWTSAPRLAAAQHHDPSVALRGCTKVYNTALMYQPSPTWPTDSAGQADYNRRREAHVDSARAVARQCLSDIHLAMLPDNMLDTLATVQWWSGQESEALGTLKRLVGSSLPLKVRYDRATTQVAYLNPTPEIVPFRRTLIAMSDSVHDIEGGAKLRLDMGWTMRKVQPLFAYRALQELVDFLATLDSAGRAATMQTANFAVYQLSDWAGEDHRSGEAIGLAAEFVALYPNNPTFLKPLVTSSHRVTHIGETAKPFASRFWMNGVGSQTSYSASSGQVTLVEFTTTWCSACKPSYVPLEHLHQELSAKGLHVMFVVPMIYGREDFTKAQGDSTVAKYEAVYGHYHITFPVMVAETKEYDEAFGVYGYPHFALIDRHGVVRDTWVGWDQQRTVEKVQALLAEN